MPEEPVWNLLLYGAGDTLVRNAAGAALGGDLSEALEENAWSLERGLKAVEQAAAQGPRRPLHVAVQLDLPDASAERWQGALEPRGARLRAWWGQNATLAGGVNTGSAAALVDFVRWGIAENPEGPIMLVLGGHGTGAADTGLTQATEGVATADERLRLFLEREGQVDRDRGVLVDSTDGDWLQSAELAAALRELAAKGIRVSVLGHDACYMASLEHLYELGGLCDQVIAGQLTLPAQGWPYHLLVERLCSPNADASTLAEGVLQDFEDTRLGTSEVPVNLAVFSGKQLIELGQRTDRLLMCAATEPGEGVIQALRRCAVPRRTSTPRGRSVALNDLLSRSHQDLGELATALRDAGGPDTASAAEAVLDCLGATRKTRWPWGEDSEHAEPRGLSGVSLYLPTGRDGERLGDELSTLTFCRMGGYAALLMRWMDELPELTDGAAASRATLRWAALRAIEEVRFDEGAEASEVPEDSGVDHSLFYMPFDHPAITDEIVDWVDGDLSDCATPSGGALNRVFMQMDIGRRPELGSGRALQLYALGEGGASPVWYQGVAGGGGLSPVLAVTGQRARVVTLPAAGHRGRDWSLDLAIRPPEEEDLGKTRPATHVPCAAALSDDGRLAAFAWSSGLVHLYETTAEMRRVAAFTVPIQARDLRVMRAAEPRGELDYCVMVRGEGSGSWVVAPAWGLDGHEVPGEVTDYLVCRGPEGSSPGHPCVVSVSGQRVHVTAWGDGRAVPEFPSVEVPIEGPLVAYLHEEQGPEGYVQGLVVAGERERLLLFRKFPTEALLESPPWQRTTPDSGRSIRRATCGRSFISCTLQNNGAGSWRLVPVLMERTGEGHELSSCRVAVADVSPFDELSLLEGGTWILIWRRDAEGVRTGLILESKGLAPPLQREIPIDLLEATQKRLASVERGVILQQEEDAAGRPCWALYRGEGGDICDADRRARTREGGQLVGAPTPNRLHGAALGLDAPEKSQVFELYELHGVPAERPDAPRPRETFMLRARGAHWAGLRVLAEPAPSVLGDRLIVPLVPSDPASTAVVLGIFQLPGDPEGAPRRVGMLPSDALLSEPSDGEIPLAWPIREDTVVPWRGSIRRVCQSRDRLFVCTEYELRVFAMVEGAAGQLELRPTWRGGTNLRAVTWMACSPTGNALVLVGEEGRIERRHGRFEQGSTVSLSQLKFSSAKPVAWALADDGWRLCMVDALGALRTWRGPATSIPTVQRLALAPHEAAFSPCGDYLVCAARAHDEGTWREWHLDDTTTGCPTRPSLASTGAVDSASPALLGRAVRRAFSPRGGQPVRRRALVIGGPSELEPVSASYWVCQDQGARSTLWVRQLAEVIKAELRALGQGPLDLLVLPRRQLWTVEVLSELEGVATTIGVVEEVGDFAKLFGALRGGGDPMAQALTLLERSLTLDQLARVTRPLATLTRLLLEHLGEPEVWGALSQALNRVPRDAAIPLGQLMYLLEAKVPQPSGDEAQRWALPGRVRACCGEVTEALNKVCPDDERSLLIHVPSQPDHASNNGYQDLRFHHAVSWLALLSAVELLEREPTQSLWSFVTTALRHVSGEVRDELLARFAGPQGERALTRRNFESLGPRPLLVMSVDREQVVDQQQRWRLRLTSTETRGPLFERVGVLSARAVEQTSMEMQDLLAMGWSDRAERYYLGQLGRSLGEDLIADLAEVLEREHSLIRAQHPNHDVHLALRLPQELMDLPLELVETQQGPLALRFALARQIWLAARDHRARGVSRDGLRALVIGAPQGAGVALDGARVEAGQVNALLDQIKAEAGGRFKVDLFVGRSLTGELMRMLLRDGRYDIVHFAGHAVDGGDDPEATGWLLSDGLLTVAEIERTLAWCETPPWFIFANACHGAAAGSAASSSLASVCARSGVAAFLGPRWKVSDRASTLMADAFYRALILERRSVGAALRQARVRLRGAKLARQGAATTRHRESNHWASYMLYGDPTAQLDDLL
ncbi:MAG: CHAT domain-containing protein [Alphaproteobacteria bacterium]|nr:CHAT domain-containing protein [Alphaproteobacteria bacterium]MCB9796063.1 CHAT domain-containing protein [Alphaproteobacteria bacterium]